MSTVIPPGYLSLLSLSPLFVKIPVSGFKLTQLPHVHYMILSVFSDSLPLPPLPVLSECVSPFLLPPTHLPLPPLSHRVIYPNCSVPCLKLWTNHYSQSKFLVCMYMYCRDLAFWLPSTLSLIAGVVHTSFVIYVCFVHYM